MATRTGEGSIARAVSYGFNQDGNDTAQGKEKFSHGQPLKKVYTPLAGPSASRTLALEILLIMDPVRLKRVFFWTASGFGTLAFIFGRLLGLTPPRRDPGLDLIIWVPCLCFLLVCLLLIRSQ